jgi:hypothetical protein
VLEDTLSQLLHQYQPERLIVAGEKAADVGWHWSHPRGVALIDITPQPLVMLTRQTRVADLALVTDILGQLTHEDGRHLLGNLKNLHARRVAVCIAKNDPWSFSDMIGLGFRRHASLDEGRTLYSYDIDTYNPARAWNNPDYWANPEMWGKHRW